MENQDKNIEKYFRKLSEEKEPQAFPNMDKVWDKIEQKLDQKARKKQFRFGNTPALQQQYWYLFH